MTYLARMLLLLYCATGSGGGGGVVDSLGPSANLELSLRS